MARKINKQIVTEAEGSNKEITFAYDTLYEIGYIEKDGEKVEPDYSFFRCRNHSYFQLVINFI